MRTAHLPAAGAALVAGLLALGGCTSSGGRDAATSSARRPAPAAPVAVRGELQMRAIDDTATAGTAGRPCTGDVSFGHGQRHLAAPPELIVHADGPYGSRAVTGHYRAARIAYRHRPGIDYVTCAAAFSVRVPGNYTSLQFQPAGAARPTWLCTVQRADVTGPLALDGSPACLTSPYVVATASAPPARVPSTGARVTR